ncbi:hypothetical protein THAOC_28921, partial [Thalassiosira oceanica]
QLLLLMASANLRKPNFLLLMASANLRKPNFLLLVASSNLEFSNFYSRSWLFSVPVLPLRLRVMAIDGNLYKLID